MDFIIYTGKLTTCF